jgi:hypothetical protein
MVDTDGTAVVHLRYFLVTDNFDSQTKTKQLFGPIARDYNIVTKFIRFIFYI